MVFMGAGNKICQHGNLKVDVTSTATHKQPHWTYTDFVFGIIQVSSIILCGNNTTGYLWFVFGILQVSSIILCGNNTTGYLWFVFGILQVSSIILCGNNTTGYLWNRAIVTGFYIALWNKLSKNLKSIVIEQEIKAHWDEEESEGINCIPVLPGQLTQWPLFFLPVQS